MAGVRQGKGPGRGGKKVVDAVQKDAAAAKDKAKVVADIAQGKTARAARNKARVERRKAEGRAKHAAQMALCEDRKRLRALRVELGSRSITADRHTELVNEIGPLAERLNMSADPIFEVTHKPVTKKVKPDMTPMSNNRPMTAMEMVLRKAAGDESAELKSTAKLADALGIGRKE